MFGIERLTPDILLLFTILTLTVVLFITEIIRIDAVACFILVLLGLSQLVPQEILFSGFSSEAVIALIAVMILSAGLERTGVMNAVTGWVLRLGGAQERRISIMLMALGGCLSGFMRSVGTVALFLPVITRIRRRTGISKSRLLLPMSFCAILGSTLTMIGTGPLIMLNSLLKNLGGLHTASGVPTAGLSLFTVLPIGLFLLGVGIIYFLLLGRYILPEVPPARLATHNSTMDYFRRIYGLGGVLYELRVPSSSPLVGKTLQQWESLLDPDVVIIGIKTGASLAVPPLRNAQIKSGSAVALLGPDNKITAFAQRHHLRQSATLTAFAEHLNVAAAGLCEAVVPPSSQLVGRDFKELHMRDRYGTQVLAVYGGNKVRRGQEIQELNLRAGDTLCMFCRWPVLADLAKSPDVVVATTDYPREKFYTAKAHMALGFTLLALILVLSTNLPVSVCLLSGAVGMIFSGVLSIDQAYAAVSWKTVFLLAGLIPLGYAVQYTGAATWLAEIILQDFDYLPYWGLEIVLAVAATLFSLVMTNIGATVLLVPIAVQLATQTHSDPRIFALIVAISTSNSFLIPTHQANALVAGPGHYKTSDFIRAGSLMSILYIVITLIGVNLIFLGD